MVSTSPTTPCKNAAVYARYDERTSTMLGETDRSGRSVRLRPGRAGRRQAEDRGDDPFQPTGQPSSLQAASQNIHS